MSTAVFYAIACTVVFYAIALFVSLLSSITRLRRYFRDCSF